MPSINICCLVIMFYLTKKSCSFDVLKIWKYNFLLVLLADLVRGCGDGMARQRESREGFLCPARGTGQGTLREVTRLDYTRKWYSLMMISRTENRVWKQCAVQDFFARDEAPQPQDGSSASLGLNRRAHWAVSASVIPTIPIPELDTIQCMKNSTIMNQNKRLLSRMLFF